MLALVHTLISLPFGVYLQNPLLILLSTFVFHLFADTLLHWNVYPDQFKKWFYPLAALDVISGVALAWFVMGDRFFTAPILLAILGGNLPDILQGFWDLTPKRIQQKISFLKPAFHFHDRLQLETKSISRGIVWQIVLVSIAIVLIKLLKNP